MAVPFLRVLKGKLTVVGKSPDGDSIRFIPAKPELLDDLYRGDRVRASRVDGSVQLRLEGIDSPETHYGKDAQPQGEPARDWLLEQVGFTDVVFDQNSTVSPPTPRPGPRRSCPRASTPTGGRSPTSSPATTATGCATARGPSSRPRCSTGRSTPARWPRACPT